MTIFNLPDLGEGLPDAEIVRWRVKEGDLVSMGQIIAEMETAKAVVEVPSPQSGRIKQLYGHAGDIIKTGEPLIAFEEMNANKTNKHPPKSPSPTDSPGDTFAFKLPDLGEGLPDAEIVEWHINQGDAIDKDQIIVSMETAKAVVDVPSPIAGTAIKCCGKKGDIIKTGETLVEIAPFDPTITIQDSSKKEEPLTTSSSQKKLTESELKIKAGPAAKNRALKYSLDINHIQASSSKGFITVEDVENAVNRNTNTSVSPYSSNQIFDIPSGRNVKAAPKVRAYAKNMNADLRQIKPGGHYGNITLQDVADWLKKQQSPTVQYSDAKLIPIRGARRSMFSGMSQSRDRVMNTTIFDDADISAWTENVDITLRFIRAIIKACRAESALNIWLDDENQNIIQHQHVNLGIAVDSASGLYVPVIKMADVKQPTDIRKELNQLKEAIKTRNIKTADLQDATITLSNFGMIAGRYATPIVSPPQVAILATGGLYTAPFVTHDGNIGFRKYVPLSLSFDHRAVTGGEAARFLAALKDDLAQSL